MMQIRFHADRFSVNVHIKHQKGSNYDEVDCGKVVGVIWAGLCISETTDLLGFF